MIDADTPSDLHEYLLLPGEQSMTPDELVSLFRGNVKAIREELDISQTELARRMGVAPSYICDIERGRRNPNLTTLAQLADALGVMPAALISTALRWQDKENPPK